MFAKSIIVATLLSAAAVNALPTNSNYGSSGSSSDSGCGSSGCGSSQPMSMESGCGSSGCGSSQPMSMESGCGSSGCGSSESSMTMDSGCGSSGCGMATSSAMSMDSGCGESGCGMATMSMDSGCGESGCGMATSTMMSESVMTTSTSMVDSTAVVETSTAAMTYSTPSYGSGGMSWNSGYDNCVQQCVASFGTPGSYQPTATSGSSGSSGSGSTITVVVAPTQGVLRYIPFAVNASVGDTIKFMWGANNHTVTKSSELTPCNKTSDVPFASGTQNKDFVFTQVVNDTNPTFFYCGTPGHCPKGMFGIINPPSTFNAPTSVSGMMSSVMANDSTGNVATYAAYTANKTAGMATASNWGANIDMSNMPSWAYEAVVENVMFTRNVLAMNPDLVNADGSVSLSSMGSTPMMVPPDVGSALAASGSSSGSSSASSPSGTASSSSPSVSPTQAGAAKTNGAISVASSKVLVGATVLVATFFAL